MRGFPLAVCVHGVQRSSTCKQKNGAYPAHLPALFLPSWFSSYSPSPCIKELANFTIPRKFLAETLALPESLEAGAVGVAKDGKRVSIQAFHHPAIVTLHTGWVAKGDGWLRGMGG